MRKGIVLMAIVSSFAAYGCSADCESVCQGRKECSNVTALEKLIDCPAFCEESAKEADEKKCTDQSDAYYECLGEQDICSENARGECSAEDEAFISCIAAAAQ